MSDNQSARQDDIEVETVGADDDLDESVIEDRQPRAPSLTRLGRYRLVREIASGGMATVNLAVADGLDKLVALKIIHPHLAQEESFVRMFLDEARLASAISHRNVCNVFDFGETDGRFYIAMDYLSGQSLRDVLRRLRKSELVIEPRKLAVYVAYMLAEACEGLHAAHELHGIDGKPLNVVHRDVSPHNLFVTYDGNMSVVDFGIARASDRIQSTATGVLKGKFSYMAPEQMRQLDIDRRADVWALGVVLWESLLLRRLFVRSSQADTVMSVMMDRVKPPSELNPDLPPELDAIVLRAISRNPAHRYTTSREMGRELMKFCRESGVMVGPIEIENLMHSLFEKELAESKALMRRAKQTTGESGVWMESTPSGFSRVSLRTGVSERSQVTSQPNIDVLNASRSSIPNVPATQLARTGDPMAVRIPSRGGKLAWIAAIVACAAIGAGLYVMRGPTAEPLAENRIEQAPAVTNAPEERADTTRPEPVVSPLPETVDKAEKSEPAATTTVRTGAIAVPRPEPKRPEPRSQRAPARGQNAAQNGKDSEPEAGTRSAPADEIATRGSEPAAPAVEPKDDPPPTPAAAPVTPLPAPVAVQPAPAPSPAPAKPQAPQKLEAQAAITELDVEGSLGSSIVLRMLSRATGSLKSCYGDAAKRANKNDFSAVPVNLVIDESGVVRQLKVASHALPELSPCINNAIKRLRSERVPDVGTVAVKFKVTFNP